jgi:hypothetical protein
MKPKMNRLKGALGIAGGAGFLVAGILVALSARKYQLSDAPMPNGKGGFMSIRDGYYLSLVLVAMAGLWMYFGIRSFRDALASERHEISAGKN